MRSKEKSVALAVICVLFGLPLRAELPSFQALGFFEELAVITPDRLLTTSIRVKRDLDFAHFILSDLAHDPVSGKDFLVGYDQRDNSPRSALGELDFTTGVLKRVGIIPGEIVINITFDGDGQLYGLTDNRDGATPHALLMIDKATAVASVAKILDSHNGPANNHQRGAIAWNSGDGFLYYADRDSDSRLFLDKLAPGSLNQTSVISGGPTISVSDMAFAEGRLWLPQALSFYSIDPNNPAAGVRDENSRPRYPTPNLESEFDVQSIVPAALSCIPGPAVACFYNRFKVEVAYDVTPQGGSGLGNVVLESVQSVKFSFFDPQNIELIVKILNACSPPFNKWWVFAGGLTNAGVTIKVTDTETKKVNTYSNPKGKLFQPFADTGAFDCP